jgi:hypothetical protein
VEHTRVDLPLKEGTLSLAWKYNTRVEVTDSANVLVYGREFVMGVKSIEVQVP